MSELIDHIETHPQIDVADANSVELLQQAFRKPLGGVVHPLRAY